MNLSTAITIGLKELNKEIAGTGTRISTSQLFLSADGQTLTIGLIPNKTRQQILGSRIGQKLIGVQLPFQSSEVFCGFLPSSFRKLFRMLQKQPHRWLQMTCVDKENGDTAKLIVLGESFRYSLDLNLFLMDTLAVFTTKFKKITLDINSVDSAIIDEEIAIATETTMQLITVTNNYFTDLATAIDAGLFIRNGKNPKKPDLYAAIEEHNLEVLKGSNSGNSIEVSPVVAESTEAYDILLSQWKEDKEAKTAKVAKQPKEVKTAKVAKQPEEVKEGIYAAKSNKSNPGKKIAGLIDLLEVGATKEQICQAFQWKDWNPKTTVVLNYGYTIKAENGVFSIAK